MNPQDYKTIHDKDVAVLVRAELKQKFPAQKFSVRTESHGSIRVSWKDGPGYRAVEEVTSFFGGKSFNGMDDSTTFERKMYKGELCQFYCYAPDLSRDLSLEFASDIARIVQFDDKYSAIEVAQDRDGSAYFKGLCDDFHNNQAAVIRYLVKSIDANNYCADEINGKLKAIEQAFDTNGGIGDRDSQLQLDRTLIVIKEYIDTHGLDTDPLDTEPLITEMDLTQFQHRWSIDPPLVKVTAPSDPAPSKRALALAPERMAENIQVQESRQPIQHLTQIESDYRSSVANHIANGDLENIISYADYRSRYYAERYSKWVLEKIESGNVSSIVSIDDWICDLMMKG